MISAFLAAGFQNNAFQVGNQPVPTFWGETGGIGKRKHPVKKNEIPVIEQAISDAIDKVTGVIKPEPAVITEAKHADQERIKALMALYKFDEIQLQNQAEALNQSIEQYRLAMIQAELDDEETLLYLL
jgi:hypothetical protein